MTVMGGIGSSLYDSKLTKKTGCWCFRNFAKRLQVWFDSAACYTIIEFVWFVGWCFSRKMIGNLPQDVWHFFGYNAKIEYRNMIGGCLINQGKPSFRKADSWNPAVWLLGLQVVLKSGISLRPFGRQDLQRGRTIEVPWPWFVTLSFQLLGGNKDWYDCFWWPQAGCSTRTVLGWVGGARGDVVGFHQQPSKMCWVNVGICRCRVNKDHQLWELITGYWQTTGYASGSLTRSMNTE